MVQVLSSRRILSYKGDVDLEAKLDEWERFADHKITRLDELLPWRYAAKAA